MTSHRWLILFSGVLVTLTGMVLPFWPFIAASWILAIIFGSALISSGLAALTRFAYTPAAKIFAIILIITGTLAIIFNEFTANVLVTVVGVTIISLSLLWLFFGLAFNAASSPITLGPAIIGIFIGMVPLIWPQFALSVLAILLGFMMTVWGIAITSSAFKTRGPKTIKIIRN